MGHSTYNYAARIDTEALKAVFNAGLFARRPTILIQTIDGEDGQPLEANLMDGTGKVIGRCSKQQIDEILDGNTCGRNPNLAVLTFLQKHWAMLAKPSDHPPTRLDEQPGNAKILKFPNP